MLTVCRCWELPLSFLCTSSTPDRLRRGIGGNRHLMQWSEGRRRRWEIRGVGGGGWRLHHVTTRITHALMVSAIILVKERRSMDAVDLNTWKMYRYPMHTACGYSTNI